MNKFFQSALRNAASTAIRPSRLLALLPKLAMKLKDANWGDVNAITAKDRFFVLGRLIRAYATGEYRNIPWKTILLVIAAVIYFLNPLDLIPDIVPLTGLTDDFAVLVWLYNTVGSEIERFQQWERTKITNL